MLAITGATGFVGGHVMRIAREQGHVVRALTRSPRAAEDKVTWIEGALDRLPALAELCRGADAVIHIAGAINAATPAEFEAANVAGTAAMIDAARAEGVRRFVHVSSLAAREPALSAYGASKARSEALFAAGGLDWDIVRPPAVYGPGDRELLELFRMAKRGVVPLPPGGRLSLIAVEDLARLLLALAETAAAGLTYEPDDGAHGGYSHAELARLIGAAVNRRVRPVAMPAGVLRVGAWLDGLVRRDRAKLTADRVRYFCHPDWVVGSTARPPDALWAPRVPTAEGLSETAGWYRAAGWL